MKSALLYRSVAVSAFCIYQCKVHRVWLKSGVQEEVVHLKEHVPAEGHGRGVCVNSNTGAFFLPGAELMNRWKRRQLQPFSYECMPRHTFACLAYIQQMKNKWTGSMDVSGKILPTAACGCILLLFRTHAFMVLILYWAYDYLHKI